MPWRRHDRSIRSLRIPLVDLEILRVDDAVVRVNDEDVWIVNLQLRLQTNYLIEHRCARNTSVDHLEFPARPKLIQPVLESGRPCLRIRSHTRIERRSCANRHDPYGARGL